MARIGARYAQFAPFDGEELDTAIDKVWEIAVGVLTGAAGGFAHLLSLKDKTRMKLWMVISDVLVSAFCGYMTLLLAHFIGISGDMVGLACGVAGWTSPYIMEFIIKQVDKALGLDKKEKENNEKKEEE